MALTSVQQDFIVKNGIVVKGNNAVTSSTSQTGALQVNGGAAIAKNLIVGSTATIFGVLTANGIYDTSLTQGELIFADGSGLLTQDSGLSYSVAGSQLSAGNVTGAVLTATSKIYNTSFTQSQLIFSGAGGLLTQDSGLSYSVAGSQLSAGNVTSAVLTATSKIYNTSFTQGQLIFSGAGGLLTQDSGLNYSSAGSQLSVGNITATIITATSKLFATGGITAVVNNYNVTDPGTVGDVIVAGGAAFGQNLIARSSQDVTSALNTSTAAVSIQAGGLYVNKSVWIDSNTAASAGQNGALVVQGGAYLGNNVYIAGTAANTGTNANNALFVAGGVGINGSLSVSQDAVFKGNVWFQGGTTNIFSTNTYYTDNLIELHVPPGGVDAQWPGDDGKDIGFRFHYYNGQDLNAAIVLANDTKWFEFYKDGQETTSTGVFTSVDYATLKAGSLLLTDTTSSTDYQSGALQVAGGIGVGGDIYLNTGKLYGTATQADNLNGGALNRIPIQSAANVTTFINAPTAPAQVLTYDGTNVMWGSASATTVGNATTATNIAGGAQYDIPFQSAPGLTTFDDGVFQYNDSAKTLKIDNVTVYGAGNLNGTYSSDNVIVSASGQTIGLYSNTGAKLNYNNVNIVNADSNGITLAVGSGTNYTLSLDTNGNLTLGGTIGGGTFTAPYVDPSNLSNGRVTYYNGSYLVDDSSLTYDGSGNLTVGTSLTVSGSGGNITMSGGNITGVGNITMGGELEITSGGSLVVDNGASVTLAYANANSVAFVNGTNGLVTDSYLTYNGTTLQTPGLNINGAYTFPTSDGSSGYVLTTNGAGTVTWEAATSTLDISGDSGTGSVNLLTQTLDIAGGAGISTTASGQTITINNTGVLALTQGTDISISGSKSNYTISDTSTLQSVTTRGSSTTNAIRFTNANATNGAATGGAVAVTGGVGIAKDLYVGSTATVGGDLYVNGNIYMQGVGLDTISSNTGTFVDVISTGTIYANVITATNITVTGTLTFPGGTFSTGSAQFVDLTVTGSTTVAGFTATNAIISTATITTATITNANLTTVNANTLQVNNTLDTTTPGTAATTQYYSMATLGGFKAAKSIIAGGVISAGDFDSTGTAYLGIPDTGTVDGFYLLNNMQSARTIKSISGTSTVNIDQWDKTLYTSAKYIVQVYDSGNIHTEELMVIQDGSYVYISEYGIVSNSGVLGTFDGAFSGGNVVIKFTPYGATNMTVQVVRQSILTNIENYAPY